MSELPAALAEKIAEIDATLARLRIEHDELRDYQLELQNRRADYLEAADICRAAWFSPSGGSGPAAESVGAADALGSGSHPGEVTPGSGLKRRRDVRGEVLALIKLCGPLNIDQLVMRLGIKARQAAAAVKYHIRGGRVIQSGLPGWYKVPAADATVAEPAIPADSDTPSSTASLPQEPAMVGRMAGLPITRSPAVGEPPSEIRRDGAAPPIETEDMPF
jgi:hypothetical protein